MRILAVAVGLAVTILSAFADPPARDPEAPPESGAPQPEKLAALVRQLDDDDAARREEAAARLLEIGTPALEALRAAAADEKIGAEGKARAAALIPGIEARQERRRIWGDNPDLVKTVREEMERLGEQVAKWELHALSGASLDQVIPKCQFVVADWTGEERKTVPSRLFAVCREPAGIVQIRARADYAALAQWIAPAVDGPSKEKVAGVLSGLERIRMQFGGPFEFRADDAKAPAGGDGATTYADTGLLSVSFDGKGLLRRVDLLDDMQRTRSK